MKAEFSVDRNDLSGSPRSWLIKDKSQAPGTIVQPISKTSREEPDLKQIHLIRMHTLFQNPRELRRRVGSVAWEIPIASDFYQLPSEAGGSFTPSLNQGVARLTGALGQGPNGSLW